MIRLLMAGLLLCASGFGWASVYPDNYEGVPHTFKDGDTIKAVDFNANNESIKEAINSISSGTATSGAQGPAGETGPAGADGAIGADGPGGATGPAGAMGPAGADAVAGEWVTDPTNASGRTVNCPLGKKAISGGCSISNGSLKGSYPYLDDNNEFTGWRCEASSGNITDSYVFCQ